MGQGRVCPIIAIGKWTGGEPADNVRAELNCYSDSLCVYEGVE